MAAKKKTETPTLTAAALNSRLPVNEETGVIKWREIINPKYIALNRNAFAARGIDVEHLTPDEVEKAKKDNPDSDLMILLGGFRQLAQLRGFKSVTYNLLANHNENAVVSCKIEFVPTEAEPYGVVYEGVGVANPANVGKNFTNVLENMAENRAFCRAVRNYFRIESLAWEEINPEEKIPVTKKSPLSESLEKKLESKGMAFEEFRDFIKKQNQQSWNDDWVNVNSIPLPQIFSFLGLLNNA